MKRPVCVNFDDDVILFHSQQTNSKYYCFSSYYKTNFFLDNKIWISTEHYKQYNKVPIEYKVDILNIADPYEVAAYGDRFGSPDNWLDICYDIMYTCTYAKFNQNKRIKEILIRTGDKLIFNDCPNDLLWGYRNGGLNYLGKILMNIRKIFIEKKINENIRSRSIQ